MLSSENNKLLLDLPVNTQTCTACVIAYRPDTIRYDVMKNLPLKTDKTGCQLNLADKLKKLQKCLFVSFCNEIDIEAAV